MLPFSPVVDVQRVDAGGKEESPDQRIMSRDERIRRCLVHRRFPNIGVNSVSTVNICKLTNPIEVLLSNAFFCLVRYFQSSPPSLILFTYSSPPPSSPLIPVFSSSILLLHLVHFSIFSSYSLPLLHDIMAIRTRTYKRMHMHHELML